MNSNSRNYDNNFLKLIKDRVVSQRKSHNILTRIYKNENIDDEVSERMKYIMNSRRKSTKFHNSYIEEQYDIPAIDISNIPIIDRNDDISIVGLGRKRDSYTNIQSFNKINKYKKNNSKDDLQNDNLDLMEKGQINVVQNETSYFVFITKLFFCNIFFNST